MREDLLTMMKQLTTEYAGWDFYITGHSLGGAFATLAAMDVITNKKYGMENLNQKLHLYTFGSPRVGDLEFVNTVQSYIPDMWRVVNNMDLVPHVPPNCAADAKEQCSMSGSFMVDKVMNFVGPKFQAFHLNI